jgi:SWIM zinc finger
MVDRWSREQVLALAPDASARVGAESVALPGPWSGTGCHSAGDEAALWGECKGSGAKPYRTCVELPAPAYRCTCPSRKFPCKHVLGLLLLWSEGAVPAAGAVPAWVAEWIEGRREREARTASRRERAERGDRAPQAASDPEAARRRGERRERRVAAGLDELDRWLRDQVRHGLAGAQRAGYQHWDAVAARMVDAQAAGVAGVLRRLVAVPASGEGWTGRLLEEYALLRLLTVAYRRGEELAEPLRETVRARVGFTVTREQVLAGPAVRDRWDVLGQRETQEDRLRMRRVWLRGRRSGRMALVLEFAAPGQPLDTSLAVGLGVDAELAFYPGVAGLRALVARRHATVPAEVPRGGTVADMLASYAAALAEDPWLDTWPALLGDVVPASDPDPGRDGAWSLADPSGAAAPLLPRAVGLPWPLLALSGGHPVTVAGEWTPAGLRPLTAWDGDGRAVVL